MVTIQVTYNRPERVIINRIKKMLNINDDNESTTLQFWNATTYYNIDYLLNNSILSDRILTFIFSTTPY